MSLVSRNVRRRLRAVAPVLAVVPLLASCSATGVNLETGRLGPDERGTRIERIGRLAGTLIVTPASVEPGMNLSVAVKNVGELTMFYGLGNRIERRMDGRWGGRHRRRLRDSQSSHSADPAEREARR